MSPYLLKKERCAAAWYGLGVREETAISELPRITAQPKTGVEPLHSSGYDLGLCVQDFWRWSASDLLSNATRGRLAEFVVATGLAISTEGVRDEWGAYDLLTKEGIRVEVKSASYIQNWYQKKPSTINFRVPKTRAWNAETNVQEAVLAAKPTFTCLRFSHPPIKKRLIRSTLTNGISSSWRPLYWIRGHEVNTRLLYVPYRS